MKKTVASILVFASICLLASCQVSQPQNDDDNKPVTPEEPYDFNIEEGNKTSIFTNEEYKLSLSSYEDLKIVSDNENVLVLDEKSATIKGNKEGESILTITSKSITKQYKIAVKENSEIEDFYYYDLNQRNGFNTMPSVGNVKILVLPIIVKDYASNANETNLEKINEAFNGGENVEYESVKDYYYKSSYGKLNLDFVVSPTWIDINKTTTEISSVSDGFYGTSVVLEEALNIYKEQNNTNLSDFDSDKDGFIDAVWMVYSAPDYQNKTTLDDAFWAFTGYLKNHDVGNTDEPLSKSFSWASYDFMENYGKSSDKIDTHTYIHETGHLFGLTDYYCYADGRISNAPAGCIDMMDLNIGDHMAYSKFALNWVKPKVVTDTTTISLRPFESSGDVILLSGDNFNNSVFDEYFLIEYITPTGLNELDYAGNYAYSGVKGYSTPGIRIYHIDSRASTKTTSYDSKFTDNIDEMYSVVNENTYTYYSKYYKAGRPFYLTTLMQNNATSTNLVTYKDNAYRYLIKTDSDGNSKMDPSDSLYKENDVFSLKEGSANRLSMPSESNKLNRYAYSYNKGDLFNYEVKVSEITDSEAKLEILRYDNA